VARSLRLAAGELVATVTVSFDDPVAHQPVAITTAMLRPDLFRIVIQAGTGPDGRTDGFCIRLDTRRNGLGTLTPDACRRCCCPAARAASPLPDPAGHAAPP
jgi:hypothetical protein